MSKLLAGAGTILGVAVWILLYVILGTGIVTAFIAAGSTFGAGILAMALTANRSLRTVLDAPVTSVGLLLGIAAFVILEVVLSSVPMWVAVVSGLGVVGLYGMADAAVGSINHQPEAAENPPERAPGSLPARAHHDGHRQPTREMIGAR